MPRKKRAALASVENINGLSSKRPKKRARHGQSQSTIGVFSSDSKECWGYAKRVYRLNPPSSREDHLERNALAALAAVPLKSMRKFAVRSRRFMDAYESGLNGRQAAWAARKYKGHRVLPVGIMEELGRLGIV